jgi:hypothetical protein
MSQGCEPLTAELGGLRTQLCGYIVVKDDSQFVALSFADIPR